VRALTCTLSAEHTLSFTEAAGGNLMDERMVILIVSRIKGFTVRRSVRGDPRIQLGKTLRRRRLALGLSQEGLAEKADLHWTYIGGIERGERNVSLLNIVRLARALGITASQLLADVK
jgi:hypothetical protein